MVESSDLISLKATPLLLSLRNAAALHRSTLGDITRLQELTNILHQSQSDRTKQATSLFSAQLLDDASCIITNLRLAQAIRYGTKSIEQEIQHVHSSLIAAELRDHLVLCSLMHNELELLGRAAVADEWQRFYQFASTYEPSWRQAAHEKSLERQHREREAMFLDITRRLLAMEEDVRQDKFGWFDEERDWWTAMKYTEEEERGAAQRRTKRRVDDAAAAAAIYAATNMPTGRPAAKSSSQPPQHAAASGPPGGGIYGGMSSPLGAPGKAPVYGYAQQSPQPAGYPQYGPRPTNPPYQPQHPSQQAAYGYPPYGTTPYSNNGQYYDPYRVNANNNYGISQPTANNAAALPGQQRPGVANQYTTNATNVFYGQR